MASSAYPASGETISVEDEQVMASLLEAQEDGAFDETSVSGSDETSDSESESSDKEDAEPTTPNEQTKPNDKDEDDDKDKDSSSAMGSSGIQPPAISDKDFLKQIVEASDEELSTLFKSLTIDAKNSVEKFKSAKVEIDKRAKETRKALRKEMTKAKNDEKKVEAMEERMKPFAVSVILPDGSSKSMEVSKDMTTGAVRNFVGTRLMNISKKKSKSLRLICGVDDICLRPRKTIGAFKAIQENSRITVSLGIQGGGKRGRVENDTMGLSDFFDYHIASPQVMETDSIAIRQCLALGKIDLPKWVSSLDEEDATKLLNILDDQKKQTSLKYLTVPYLDFVKEQKDLKD